MICVGGGTASAEGASVVSEADAPKPAARELPVESSSPYRAARISAPTASSRIPAEIHR